MQDQGTVMMKEHAIIKDDFPFHLFVVYICFYSGQSIYNTYLNLYLHSVGLSQSQIGVVVSVATLFIVVAQIFWGVASDKVSAKNSVLSLLFFLAAITASMFYLNHSFGFIVFAVLVFSVFFNPIVPLLDNYALELLENNRRDYGEIRIGGTIGYCLTVLSIGFFLSDSYERIFWLVSVCMILCFLLSLTMPKVKAYRNTPVKSSYSHLFKNKQLIVLVLFNLVFSMGLNFFYNFYPIYFTSIGGNSAKVGMMMFFCAVTEIPLLLVIRRLVNRIGIRGILLIAGGATTIRWVLLFWITSPNAAIVANLLHGLGYTSFSYCLITFIGRVMPKDLRATGQTFNAMIGVIGSKIIFGYVGGVASDFFGVNKIMLLNGLLMLISTIAFFFWSKSKTALLSQAY